MSLTEDGNEKIEQLLRDDGLLKEGDLYDAQNATLVHHMNQALRAHTLFQRDKDYIVRNGEVVIIDEFTGRMMQGRRYSEGLHQALEAKEHVQVQPENQTLASITFQNYFRLYGKLARHDRHGRDRSRRVPGDLQPRRGRGPDQPARRPRRRGRRGLPDGGREATKASSARSRPPPPRGQPILVGTTSIEKSEHLAELLIKDGFTLIDFENPHGARAALQGGPRRASGIQATSPC